MHETQLESDKAAEDIWKETEKVGLASLPVSSCATAAGWHCVLSALPVCHLHAPSKMIVHTMLVNTRIFY